MDNQTNITSNNQSGGITAQNVNTAKPNEIKKRSDLKIIVIISGIVAFVASVVTILDYMKIDILN